ncbi:MAG TPA: DUF2066 domain-containing protein [Stellaceae bacterium]|nr:DUF2066 domain-containing protein [Stellaceae bacterium]
MTLPEAPAVAVYGSGPGYKSGFATALVLLALLFGVSAPPARAADDDPFTVTVPVDATADSIVSARDKARHDGEHRALAAIAERVAAGSGASPKLAKLDDNAVTNLVASFEVANERMSAVRYLADYTFHFRPAETQRVLKSAGISPSAAAADAAAGPGGKPIVMLPVYQAGGRAVLWDDPNPWRQAWAELPPSSGASPLAVPLGDVGDIAAIDAEKARTADAGALAAIAKKNGGEDVIVTLATPRAAGKPETAGKPDIAGIVTTTPGSPAGLDVTVRRYRQGRLAETHVAPVEGKPGEAPDALLQRAAATIAAGIQTGWKQETGDKYDQRGSLTATAPITGLDDWIKLRDSLASLGTIRKVDLMALSRQEAVVEIDYVGSVDQLQASLAALGLALARGDTGGDRSWRLARSETPASR